jgi:hypothetical protein
VERFEPGIGGMPPLPPPARPPGLWTSRLMLGLAAFVAVLVLAGGVLLVVQRQSNDQTAGPSTTATLPTAPTSQSGTSTAPTTTASRTHSTSSSVTTSGGGVPTGSADGLVTINPATAENIPPDVANAVITTLDHYFSAVNGHQLAAAYALFTTAQRQKNPFDTWSAGVASSGMSDVVVSNVDGAIRSVGAGPVTAAVSFVSRQPGDLGPTPGQTCTKWSLMYTLVANADKTGYLIDGAKAQSGDGFTAC